nr:uncharacterized protein LOC124067871 isoform X2 [Scatophagus argus]
MIRPWTPEKRNRACHDVTIVMETHNTRGSDADMILTTRLSMLRELLQGDTSQEKEVSDVQRQHHCPEHLRTTTRSTWSPQTSVPLSVWRSVLKEEQVTGDQIQKEVTNTADTESCAIISLVSAGGGARDTPASSPGPPVRPFLKTRDDYSLPTSPHPGGWRRLPCSLPCSPLLGGRSWRSAPTSPSPPSRLSRLWVEAALQRSKNTRQNEPHPSPPCSPQVRQEKEEEGMRSSGETEEEWTDEGKEEDKLANTVGIRLSDTIIFRSKTSPSVCGREEDKEDEEEEEDSDLLGLDSETFRYCLLIPCICSRCPSAPPYEAEVFSAGDIQPLSWSSSGFQKHSKELTQLSRGTDIQRTDLKRMDIQRSEGGSEQSLLTDRAPQLAESSVLYPSLSLWRVTADSQTELSRKQDEELNSFNSQLVQKIVQSHFHGSNTDLQHLCETISGELQTFCSADLSFILKKVLDSTTCSRRTAHPDESCSICSDKISMQIMKLLCRNCDQVFCVRCLCHFVSLLQIHQFSQCAAV